MTELKTGQNSTQPPSGILSRISHFTSRRASRERLPGAKSQLTFWTLLVGGLALDLWSKKVVFDRLTDPHSFIVVIDGLLNLVRAENNGAAFGICAGQPFALAAASLVALVIVLVYFLFSGARQKLVQVALGLLAAGICGNLYDRVFNEGYVRDFIDVYIKVFGAERHWHTFNVADALLCIGVGLLVIWTGTTGKSSQRHAQQHK